MLISDQTIKLIILGIKEEIEKSSLKCNIQKTKIMASGPFTSWQIDGETVTDYFGGSKITADGDCSHEIKRCHKIKINFPWKESYDHPR